MRYPADMVKLSLEQIAALNTRLAALSPDPRNEFADWEKEPQPRPDNWPLVLGEKEGDPDKLYILGAIVREGGRAILEEIYPDDVSGSQITRLMECYKGDRLEVIINSPGGSVYEGALAYEALAAKRAAGVEMTCFIAGQAASAATCVMGAASRIEIGEMGTVFVHPPQSGAYGGAAQMRAAADELDKIEANYLALMKTTRGVDLAEAIHAKSADGEGTLYGAKEAVAAGLVDAVRDDAKAAAAPAAEDPLPQPKAEGEGEGERPAPEDPEACANLSGDGKGSAKSEPPTPEPEEKFSEGLTAEQVARRDEELALGLWVETPREES